MASLLTRLQPRLILNSRIISTSMRLNSSESKKQGEPAKKASSTPIKTFDSGQSPITWKSLFLGGSILGCMTMYFVYLKNQKMDKIAKDKTRVIGEAAIEGSFELIDTKGNLRKSEEFKGKWMLVYFGFCHCPDVCPEELEKLSEVLEHFAKEKKEIVPLFITVDPDRDTPELIGKYLSEFSDKFIGLTGNKEQIDRATRAFRVYYSPGPKDKDSDYIVDHSIITYLIGPNSELVNYFGQTKTAEEIKNTITYHMVSYKK